MTYLINDDFSKPGGPILFYTGNEGSIEHFAANTGFMTELAEQLSAVVIFAEHRYYGSSLPFGNNSFKAKEYFGYLSAEQALADYASFLSEFKCTNPDFESSPVIAFGGSYGGMLTAWFRQKYPHIVAGGLAASAPVFLFPGMADCEGFFRVLTDAYRQIGSDLCVRTIRKTWDLMEEVVKMSDGLAKLSSAFKLCNPVKSLDALYDFASDYLVTLGMGNYPYESTFLGALPAWPVNEFCKALDTCPTTGTLPKEVESFSCAFFALANYNRTDECLAMENSDENLDTSGWYLQTCLEMTTPLCANGITDMFKPIAWDPVAYSDNCLAKFGVRPRMDWANTLFGGRDLRSLTNVIFSNGDLDPWSAYGVLDNELAPNVHVLNIANGAHHLDLRASHPNDTTEIKTARRLEKMIIQNWIKQWQNDQLLQTSIGSTCPGFL